MIGFQAVGELEELTYVCVGDDGHGFLIDPGAEPDRLLAWIRENGWTVDAILLTHGHFDHIGAAESLRDELDAPVWAHEKSGTYLQDPQVNLSGTFGRPVSFAADRLLTDGEELKSATGSVTLRVLYTPGHTEDSVTYWREEDGTAFVGDTIFAGSVGRTDLPGGSREKLAESILERILVLPEDTVLYSGHSGPTTVGTEKRRYGIA